MAYGTTQAVAERIAAEFNERDPYPNPMRPTVRYVVYGYEWNESSREPITWGIVRRWRYADRPDLGEFGGEFMWLDRRRLNA